MYGENFWKKNTQIYRLYESTALQFWNTANYYDYKKETLPAAKIRYLGPKGVLRHRYTIPQGTGTKRTGTLSDSNMAES